MGWERLRQTSLSGRLWVWILYTNYWELAWVDDLNNEVVWLGSSTVCIHKESYFNDPTTSERKQILSAALGEKPNQLSPSLFLSILQLIKYKALYVLRLQALQNCF